MCRVVPANAAEKADLVDADLVDMVRDKSGMCMAAELCVCSTGAVCSKLPRSDAPDWDSDSSSLSSLAGRIMSWRQPGEQTPSSQLHRVPRVAAAWVVTTKGLAPVTFALRSMPREAQQQGSAC